MDTLQQQFVRDHHRITRVLNLIEAELSRCEHMPHTDIDLSLIIDGLEYISAYPEQYHHPMEEKIIRLINGKSFIGGLNRLSAQHQFLEQETRRFKNLFNLIANGCLIDLKRLINQFRRYCDMQLDHLKLEDEILLPAIATSLSTRECAVLRAELDRESGEVTKAEFSDLYRSLVLPREDIAA
jgi:hemerythrin-like domain-containing protein